MSITIFARNFRGFKRLTVPLDMNIFLVGDNSSGKTSVIHLVSYVLNTNLKTNDLDRRYNVGRYDFFSPYFDYSDVTIGYVGKDADDFNAVLITLKYNGPGKRPSLVKFTTIKNGDRATFWVKEDALLLKVSYLDEEFGINDLYKMHDEYSGFLDPLEYSGTSDIKNASDILSIVISTIPKVLNDTDGAFKDVGQAFKALVQESLPNTHHIGPLRGLPERFYPLNRVVKASGGHFAAMWHDLKDTAGISSFDLIRKFGRESKLFEDIDIEKIAEKFEDSPLIVTVRRHEKEFLLNQVGIGVSQVIPILIESIFTMHMVGSDHTRKDYLLLQQPELHLHPVAQAAMGDFIFDMSMQGLKYIVETHSDYIIDRYRARIRETENFTNAAARVLYFENGNDGNSYYEIGINSDGSLYDVPDNYKDFFVNEFVRTMF